MATDTVDEWLEQVAGGLALSEAQLLDLAGRAEVLQIGMLADAARRQRHGTRTTYVRVAEVAFDGREWSVPPAAGAVELTGTPANLDSAVETIARVRAAAGERAVSALSWADVERLSGGAASTPEVLARVKAAGLDAIASLPLDHPGGLDAAVAALAAAGFRHLTLSLDAAPMGDRLRLFQEANRLQQSHGGIEALDPLPRVLRTLGPTTGYEDVKTVALARLAASHVPSIQVDWRRYGPKLAQVALTFGADDVNGVSASDEAPEGRRRAARDEIRRNIDAAGFVPAERDGRFQVLV